MAHKTNKLISIVLMLTMIIGMTGVIHITSHASGGSITLIGPERSDLPEGSVVRLGIDAESTEGIALFKLFTSIDGVHYNECGKYGADDVYALADVKSTVRYYIVKAYDESGSEIAVSNAVSIGGVREKVKSTVWNLDFDSQELSVIASSNDRFLSADGVNILRANGDAVGMHVGDEDNTITIGSTSAVDGGSNGNSLIFTTNGNAGTCQINNGWAKISGGIAVYSVDVATSNYETKTLLTGAAAKAAGGNQWMTTVETRPDGRMLMYLRSQDAALRAPGVTKITSGADAGYVLVGTYETNKWYNVKFVMNIEAGTLDVYINDTYIATDYDRVSTTMTPARFQISNGAKDGCLYVDNIKAYMLEYVTVNPGLSIYCETKDFALPEGTMVKIDISSTDVDDVTRIDLLKSVDGEEYTVESSFSEENAVAWVELSKSAESYKAVAYDSSDVAIVESEVLELSASPVVINETLWDIDFETEKFNSSAEYRYLCDDTLTALSMNHSGATSTLTAHTGSLNNDITIADSGDDAYGNAVKFDINDTKQVQFNEFRARTTGGVVVGQWDIKFDSLPSNSSSLLAYLMDPEVAPDGTGAKERASAELSLKYNGGTACFSYKDDGETCYLDEISTGVWYNIKTYTDLDNGVVTVLIDNKFAFRKSFDSSCTWFEKYVFRFGNASGCEVWLDNFLVQKALVVPVPKVVSIANDENSLYVEFAHELDADLFYNSKNEICNISVDYEGNALDIISCEFTDNPKILRFVSEKKVYTSVPLNIEITVPYGVDETMVCREIYTAPAADFDVTAVDAEYDGSRYAIEAVFCNSTGKEQSAVMVAVFYDKDRNIVAVRPSALYENVTDGTKISLSGNVEAEKMNIFFIDNWMSSTAIKNVVYTR